MKQIANERIPHVRPVSYASVLQYVRAQLGESKADPGSALDICRDELISSQLFNVTHCRREGGFAQVRTAPLNGKRHLEKLYVTFEMRRRGIGRSLVNQLKITSVSPLVAETDAIKFFVALGFRRNPVQNTIGRLNLVR